MSNLLTSLQDKIADGTIAKDIANTTDRVLGPSPNYVAGIKTPGTLGVGDAGTVDQVINNARAIGAYTNVLTRGPLQGNQFFLDTGGTCIVSDPNDPNNGKEVPRATYVNNRMGGQDVASAFPGLGSALGGQLDEFNGIIPGMMGDVVATNPITVMNALVLPGKPRCKAYSCPTTDRAGGSRGDKAHYLTIGLEQAPGRCKQVRTAGMGPASPELFGNKFGGSIHIPHQNVQSNMADKILFAIAVLGFTFLAMHKL